jgi:hypothetical protein
MRKRGEGQEDEQEEERRGESIRLETGRTVASLGEPLSGLIP